MKLDNYTTQQLIEELEARMPQQEQEFSHYASYCDETYTPGMHELMDLEKELSLVPNEIFNKALTVKECDTKCKLYLHDQPITLTLDDKKKVQFTLNDINIKGKKKTQCIITIIKYSKDIHHSHSGDWEMYKFKYNGKVFTAGWMIDNHALSFMKLNNPSADEYYNVYWEPYKSKLQPLTYEPMDKHEDMYGWKDANNMAEFQEDQLRYSLDMALDAGRISYEQYIDIIKD